MSKFKVLLLAGELFSRVPNGGSRFYEKIVLDNPNVEFTSFTQKMLPGLKTPANLKVQELGISPNKTQMEKLLNSVSGERFDVIDWPDWLLPSDHPREILNKFRVEYGKLVTGLHGSTSSVLRYSLKYKERQEELLSFKRLENILYKTSDGIYGISKYYAADLGLLEKTSIVQPIHFIKKFPKDNRSRLNRNLNFLGRRDGTKGFGDFLKLVGNLPTDWHANIYGPDSYIFEEACDWNRLTFLLRDKISENRQFTEDEVANVFHLRNGLYAFLSKFDSFNLSAADALSAGQFCLLYENLPAVRYLKDLGIEIPQQMILNPNNIVEAIAICVDFVNKPEHVDELENLRRSIQDKMFMRHEQVCIESLYSA